FRYFFQRLAGVLREQLVQQPAVAKDLFRLDLDVHRLASGLAVGLVDQDARVRQRVPLALRPRAEQDRGGRRRLPHAQGRDVRLDVLHRVVDREKRRDRTARRVDVDRDVLRRVLGLEVDQLRHDQVRDGVVDLGPEENDPLLEQPRVDVERAFPTVRLLDDDGNHVVLHDVLLAITPDGYAVLASPLTSTFPTI